MRLFLHGPIDKPFALLDKKYLQRSRATQLREHGFFLAGNIEVHEGDMQFGKPMHLTQQMAVDQRLGPVQDTMIGRHRIEVAPIRLDLFQPVDRRIVAACPPRSDARMARDSLLGRWCGCEAQVEVAAPGRKLAERAHRHT